MALTPTHPRWSLRKIVSRAFQYLVLSVVMVMVLVPVVMLVFGGLKTRGEIMTRPYTPPIPPRWENYQKILGQPEFWLMLRNSLAVMAAVTFLVVVLCSLAAFVFARMDFRGKGLAFNLFTLGLMFPINIAILPVYFVLRQLHLIDNLWGVIAVQTAFQLSGNILILRGFFAAIPSELQDAAYIDGCSVFDFFWRVLLPLARPALSAVAALTMIVSWNDLLVPLVVLNDDKLWPLPLGTMQFQGQYGQDLALVAAFVTISAIPTVLFYLVAERQIVSGLTAGAIKGLRLMRASLLTLTLAALLAACGGAALPVGTPAAGAPAGAFASGKYRNLFGEYLGKSDAEVQARLDQAWQRLFYGDDASQRVYYPVGADMAYIEDIGNGDVRTEGMSYGMMIAVQLNKQAEFDRLWKWAKTYMYQSSGPYQGYFAWHCDPAGKKLDANPASDGEEWFSMSLLFASGRWGDGGPVNYRAEAQALLDTMLHKAEQNSDLATNMFDGDHKLVVFVPRIGKDSSFSDASYQLPAYYELWARWAARDNQFWRDAAEASRAYFKKAADPATGLMPDYGNFDGSPHGSDEHKDFRFDAWRTLSNVAVDYAWFAADPWQVQQSDRVLGFLAGRGVNAYGNQFALDGKELSGDHSTGLAAMAAVAALAADPAKGKPFVQALWDTGVPSGRWRYYDGMLYMLALLHVSGRFQIYPPAAR